MAGSRRKLAVCSDIVTTILASMELEEDDYSFGEAPDQLQMERERSSLVWQELMDVVLGWEFVTMKRDKGMRINFMHTLGIHYNFSIVDYCSCDICMYTVE